MTPESARPAASSPDIAFRAYREGAPLVARVAGLDALRLTGGDCIDFLHGQVTDDIRSLPTGGVSDGLMLNHKGHALAQHTSVRRERDMYLAVESGRGGFVLAELERHIVFDQVELQDLRGAIGAVTVQGPRDEVERAVHRLGVALPEPGLTSAVAFEDAEILVHRSARSAAGGVDVHALSRHVDRVIALLVQGGALEADPDVLPLLRVVAGIARAPDDAGDGVLPQEAGLESLVSYRKGCYLGQEIMARIEARGSLRRSLGGLRLDEEPSGRDVEHEGRVVGRLGTVVRHPDLGWIGLAVIRDDVSAEAELQAGGVAARRHPLPFDTGPVARESTPPLARMRS